MHATHQPGEACPEPTPPIGTATDLAALLSDDPVLECGAGAADMEHSGRRRGEAYSYSHETSLRPPSRAFPATFYHDVY